MNGKHGTLFAILMLLVGILIGRSLDRPAKQASPEPLRDTDSRDIVGPRHGTTVPHIGAGSGTSLPFGCTLEPRSLCKPERSDEPIFL